MHGTRTIFVLLASSRASLHTNAHIGVDDVNKSVNEIVKLIEDDKSFVVLIPISVTSEIARLENKDGERQHDYELAKKVQGMSKITLASSAEVWLINLPGESFNHFYNNDMEGLGFIGIQEVFLESYEEMRILSKVHGDKDEEEYEVPMEAFPISYKVVKEIKQSSGCSPRLEQHPNSRS